MCFLAGPIVGSVEHHEVPTDISFDESDFDALKEFLGPEVKWITISTNFKACSLCSLLAQRFKRK